MAQVFRKGTQVSADIQRKEQQREGQGGPLPLEAAGLEGIKGCSSRCGSSEYSQEKAGYCLAHVPIVGGPQHFSVSASCPGCWSSQSPFHTPGVDSDELSARLLSRVLPAHLHSLILLPHKFSASPTLPGTPFFLLLFRSCLPSLFQRSSPPENY